MTGRPINNTFEEDIQEAQSGKYEILFEHIDVELKKHDPQLNRHDEARLLDNLANKLKVTEDHLLVLESTKIQFFINSRLRKTLSRNYRIEWLRICLNLKKDPHVEYYHDLRGTDREEEVKQCLLKWDNGKPEPLTKEENIDDFFLQQPERIYLKVIADWFIRRYDIKTGKILVDIITRKESARKIFNRFYPSDIFFFHPSGVVFRTVSFVILLLLLSLPALCHLIPSLSVYVDYPISLLPLCLKGKGTILQSSLFYSPLFSLLVFAIYPCCLYVLLFMVTCPDSRIRMHLALPRLIGSIVVGFVPLLPVKDIWSFAREISFYQALAIVLSAIVTAFIYLLVEVENQKVTPRSKRFLILSIKTNPVLRALSVMLNGLTISILISVAASDLIGRYLPGSSHEGVKIKPLVGIFGTVNIQAVLVFASLALLIGIFIQVFWEEKTITEPL